MKSNKGLIIVLIFIMSAFILVTVSPAQAADVYVVIVNGNNDNNGSSEGTAWKTLHHAIGWINQNLGDYTLHVLPGTYSYPDESDEFLIITNANTVILLGRWQDGNHLGRAAFVLKHRGQPCSEEVVPFGIADGGIEATAVEQDTQDGAG